MPYDWHPAIPNHLTEQRNDWAAVQCFICWHRRNQHVADGSQGHCVAPSALARLVDDDTLDESDRTCSCTGWVRGLVPQGKLTHGLTRLTDDFDAECGTCTHLLVAHSTELGCQLCPCDVHELQAASGGSVGRPVAATYRSTSSTDLATIAYYGPELALFIERRTQVENRFLLHLDLEQLRRELEAVPTPAGIDDDARERMDEFRRHSFAQAALLLGDFAPSWVRSLEFKPRYDDILNERAYCDDLGPLSVKEFPLTHGATTLLGRQRFAAEIAEEFSTQLRLREVAEGMNIVESFYRQWGDSDLSAEELQERLEEEGLELKILGPEWDPGAWHEHWKRRFGGGGADWHVTVGNHHYLLPVKLRRLPPMVRTLLDQRLRAMAREAENIVRGRNGLVSVGEGWVSEAALAAEIRDRFPELDVARHARPPWLAPQHLDIYIKSIRVGVEYQGVQHSQPIARFGGEEGFALQQERDARKRRLCEENGCTLIEVHPGYDFEDVARQIEACRDRIIG